MNGNDQYLEIVLSAKAQAEQAFAQVEGLLRGLQGQVKQANESMGAGFMAKWQQWVITLSQGIQLYQQTIGRAVSIGVGFVRSVLDQAGAFEMYRTRLGIVMRDQDAAARSFERLKEIARSSPFPVADLVQATLVLHRYGIESDAVREKIVNLAAYMGTTASEAAEKFARAYATGMIRDRELQAFVTLTTGVERLTKLSLPELRKALLAAISSPELVRAAKKLDDDWNGMVNSLADEWEQFKAGIGEAGFLDVVKKEAAGVLKTIDEMRRDGRLQEIEKLISEKLSAGFKAIVEYVKQIDVDRLAEAAVNMGKIADAIVRIAPYALKGGAWLLGGVADFINGMAKQWNMEMDQLAASQEVMEQAQRWRVDQPVWKPRSLSYGPAGDEELRRRVKDASYLSTLTGTVPIPFENPEGFIDTLDKVAQAQEPVVKNIKETTKAADDGKPSIDKYTQGMNDGSDKAKDLAKMLADVNDEIAKLADPTKTAAIEAAALARSLHDSGLSMEEAAKKAGELKDKKLDAAYRDAREQVDMLRAGMGEADIEIANQTKAFQVLGGTYEDAFAAATDLVNVKFEKGPLLDLQDEWRVLTGQITESQLAVEKFVRSAPEGMKAVARATAEAVEAAKAGTIHLGSFLRDGLKQVGEAVVLGTRDIKDVAKGLGEAFVSNFFDKVLEDKLRNFDPAFNANFLRDLPGAVQQGTTSMWGFFTNLFSMIAGGFSSLFGGGGGGVTGGSSGGSWLGMIGQVFSGLTSLLGLGGIGGVGGVGGYGSMVGNFLGTSGGTGLIQLGASLGLPGFAGISASLAGMANASAIAATLTGGATAALVPTTTAGVLAFVENGVVTGLILADGTFVAIEGGASAAAAGVATGPSMGASLAAAGYGALIGAAVVGAVINSQALVAAGDPRRVRNAPTFGGMTTLGMSLPMISAEQNARYGHLWDSLLDSMLPGIMQAVRAFTQQGPGLRDLAIEGLASTLDEITKSHFFSPGTDAINQSFRRRVPGRAAIKGNEELDFWSRLIGRDLSKEAGFGKFGINKDITTMIEGGLARAEAAGRDPLEVIGRIMRQLYQWPEALKLVNDAFLKHHEIILKDGKTQEEYAVKLGHLAEMFRRVPPGVDATIAAMRALEEYGYATARNMTRAGIEIARENAMASGRLTMDFERIDKLGIEDLRGEKGKGEKKARQAIRQAEADAHDMLSSFERGLAEAMGGTAEILRQSLGDVQDTFTAFNLLRGKHGLKELPDMVSAAADAIQAWGKAVLAAVDEFRQLREESEQFVMDLAREIAGLRDVAIPLDAFDAAIARVTVDLNNAQTAAGELLNLNRLMDLERARAQVQIDNLNSELQDIQGMASILDSVRATIAEMRAMGTEGATGQALAEQIADVKERLAAAEPEDRGTYAGQLVELYAQQVRDAADTYGTQSEEFRAIREQALAEMEAFESEAATADDRQKEIAKDIKAIRVALADRLEDLGVAVVTAMGERMDEIRAQLAVIFPDPEELEQVLADPQFALIVVQTKMLDYMKVVAEWAKAALAGLTKRKYEEPDWLADYFAEPPGAQEGGYTRYGGLVRTHPNEVILPLDDFRSRRALGSADAQPIQVIVNAPPPPPGMTNADMVLYGRLMGQGITAEMESWRRSLERSKRAV